MHFGGMKHLIDSGKLNLPEWVRQLEWSGQQVMPQPYTEISQEEWFTLGICGHEVEQESFYDGWNILGETEWFGGLSTQIRVYYTYALAVMHRYTSYPDKVELGKGQIIRRDEYGSFVIRFFKIGCSHDWRDVPSESRMCYHVSCCSKCGMSRAIDSSD